MDWVLVVFLCALSFCAGGLIMNQIVWRDLKRKSDALSREINNNIRQSNERWEQFNRDMAAALKEEV